MDRSMTLLTGSFLLSVLMSACGATAPIDDQELGPDPDAALEAAIGRVNAGDPAGGLAMINSLTPRDDQQEWTLFSARVATLRQLGDWSGALAATDEMATLSPELAGLMSLWDSDTHFMAGDEQSALAASWGAYYSEASVRIGDRALAAVALDQIAGLYEHMGDLSAASRVKRRLLAERPFDQDPEFLMAEILVLEARDSGQLPADFRLSPDLESSCTLEVPCLVGARSGTPVRLAGLDHLDFRLTDADLAALDGVASADPAEEDLPAPPTCTTPTASNGFQDPVTTSTYGYVFMEYPDSTDGYHPGVDSNGPGGCDDDYGMAIYSMAKGCVTDAGVTTWGSATIQSKWNSSVWTHQYGHMYYLYYSSGSSIAKGATLGLMGDVGTECAHLHWEIREDDHPDATNADYYSTSSKSNVGDWYQEPETFIDSRIAYSDADFFDEDEFSRTGTWTRVTTVGSGDDMRYATTTSTGSKSNYARYSFTPASSGTWQLWSFVPWKYATSTKAPVKLVRTSDSSTLISGTINQNSYYDAWVKVGSASLSTTKTYYVEVASNTGETGRDAATVGLDGFLIIKP